jgi:hypothetical protein
MALLEEIRNRDTHSIEIEVPVCIPKNLLWNRAEKDQSIIEDAK